MEDSKKVRIINRSGNGTVFYTIPDMGNLNRVFQDGQEKIITYEEIRKLSYVPGGMGLLKEYLIIDDKQVLDELNFDPEPEYYYTKEDIIKLMQTGTLDEFLDCLDFAPEGVKESIKTIAVDLPLNDVAKRRAIEEKLGFSVDNAIRIKQQTEQEESEPVSKSGTKRRAAAPSKAEQNQSKGSSSGRRVIKTE